MKYNRVVWTDVLTIAVIIWLSLIALSHFGYIPIPSDIKYLVIAIASVGLAIFQNVLDVIWESAKYRKRRKMRQYLEGLSKQKPLITQKNSIGFLYFIRRHKDGVYKIGITTEPYNRFRTLQKKHGMFSLMAFWQLAELRPNEVVALEMTKPYFYKEGKQRELRKMTEGQAASFIHEFTQTLYANRRKTT